jgi:hypothetical protein
MRPEVTSGFGERGVALVERPLRDPPDGIVEAEHAPLEALVPVHHVEDLQVRQEDP